MESLKVRIWVCASGGYQSRQSKVREALMQELNLNRSQIECTPSGSRELKVDVVINGQAQTVFHSTGFDFFPRQAPMNVVEAVRKYL